LLHSLTSKQSVEFFRIRVVRARTTHKDTATLQPEPTQHSKPTFVWVHIAGTCGYI